MPFLSNSHFGELSFCITLARGNNQPLPRVLHAAHRYNNIATSDRGLNVLSSSCTQDKYSPSLLALMAIIVPHTTVPLSAPPASIPPSRIASWNRGQSSPREIEGLRIVAIIQMLLPYVTFAPRAGRGGWDSRPAGFKGANDLGWGYVNILDILDDLVADFALVQPNMSECRAIDPSSNTVVDTDVSSHLRGFSRSAQLLLQYALTVARSVKLETVRVYYPAAFPFHPPGPVAIMIPHISVLLPKPPLAPTPSQVVNWNRGADAPPQLEALRVVTIIWRLLPYVTFTPSPGRGGWDARPVGFKAAGDFGWGYANTLDILDELVAALAMLQPNLSECMAIDPSSNVAVEDDVAYHLLGFGRSSQLLLQYALKVARSVTLETVRAYNPAVPPTPHTAIVIPHTSRYLPPPPASQSASQIAYWNRGGSSAREIEGLKVVAIIRLLFPYATFVPRGDDGWSARGSFHSHSLGWSYNNALDTLDELVADLSLIQPSMAQYVAINPSSDATVDADVAHHLQDFSRPARLLLQYALQVARGATLATVRAYNPAAFLPYNSPVAAL